MYIVPFNFHLGAEEPMGGGGSSINRLLKGHGCTMTPFMCA